MGKNDFFEPSCDFGPLTLGRRVKGAGVSADSLMKNGQNADRPIFASSGLLREALEKVNIRLVGVAGRVFKVLAQFVEDDEDARKALATRSGDGLSYGRKHALGSWRT
jgi:hypothetical protein